VATGEGLRAVGVTATVVAGWAVVSVAVGGGGVVAANVGSDAWVRDGTGVGVACTRGGSSFVGVTVGGGAQQPHAAAPSATTSNMAGTMRLLSVLYMLLRLTNWPGLTAATL